MPEAHDVSPALSAAHEAPDRNLALELVRVTEAAAMAAGRWVGRGDKNGADGVAVNAMRTLISTVGMRGVVVIGEGEKDNAPMLFNGEQVGDGTGPECDVAVDPIDGTTLAAKGMTNAIAVMAVAPRGSMYDPSAVFYMEKLVTGPEAADVVDIRYPIAENIHQVAKAKGSAPEDVTVVLLDRPRHEKIADGDPRHRRPDQVHHRRRRRRRDHGGPRRHRHRPAARHRRHPGGHHRRLRDEVPRRRDPGPAVAQGRRGAAARARRRPRPRPRHGADHRRPGHRRRRASSWPPASPTASSCRASATAAAAPRTHSLVMRSRSGTIRSISSEHKLQKLKAYAAVDFGR